MTNREFHVDVNITQRCTMNCDYCFAMKPGKHSQLDDVDKIISFLKVFLDSTLFKDTYKRLVVNMWGGEPTMRMDHINAICNAFEHDSRIRLFIFTNGYKTNELKELLLRFKDNKLPGEPKLCIQISYDGEPIHDIKRRASGKLTSNIVRKFILWCNINKVPFVIKSTVTPDTFKYMYWAYRDIFSLYKECGNSGVKSINYFPTIDYYESENISQVEHERYMAELEISLSDIAAIEYKNVLKGRFFFAWFNASRAKCSAGKHSMAIDVDGSIYACHGCMYGEDKENHRVSSIESPDWESYMKTDVFQGHRYDELMKNEHPDCVKCPVEYCLRCNHAKFERSEKVDYLEKWFDFSNQPYLCDYYKINNIVKEAMYKVGGKKIDMHRTL